MRILHTADWHLGKKLDQNDRGEEHSLFLNWLLDCIHREKIDALIIAGDIFDTGSPANETLKMYYNFLVQLRQTCCRQAVIIGGNHDSISTLNAPRELLKALQVHVVGGVPDNASEQIIELTDDSGKVQAVVAAVPFLRDRDVRLSVPGESATEREQRLREGISAHYHKLLPLLEPYIQQKIPVVATGHLFAQGAAASDSEKEIHVGTLGQIPASAFPAAYNYIALGHLHRPQTVGGLPHIRYSGSPIALSFSEAGDSKQVVLLETSDGQPLQINPLTIPRFRPLIRIAGLPDEVRLKIKTLDLALEPWQLPAWVEVQVFTNSLLTQLQEELLQILKDNPGFGMLCLRQLRTREQRGIQEATTEYFQLTDMSPGHVFDLRIETLGEESDKETLKETYREVLQLLAEKEGVL